MRPSLPAWFIYLTCAITVMLLLGLLLLPATAQPGAGAAGRALNLRFPGL